MAASDFLRDLLLQWAFSADVVTRPSTWYVGLINSGGTEVSTGVEDANYARQAVTLETYATTGRVRNDATVSFPAAAAGADYDVHGFAIYDASSGGNELMRADLEFVKNILATQVLAFEVGDIVLGVD